MTQHEFFQPTDRNKLINRKQTASPSLHHGCDQKQLLDRRSGMPQRTEIKIKTKIPKRNQTSKYICPDHLSTTKRGKARQREKERAIFSEQLLRELQTESNSQALKQRNSSNSPPF